MICEVGGREKRETKCLPTADVRAWKRGEPKNIMFKCEEIMHNVLILDMYNLILTYLRS
jgi:hypothetical protein